MDPIKYIKSINSQHIEKLIFRQKNLHLWIYDWNFFCSERFVLLGAFYYYSLTCMFKISNKMFEISKCLHLVRFYDTKWFHLTEETQLRLSSRIISIDPGLTRSLGVSFRVSEADLNLRFHSFCLRIRGLPGGWYSRQLKVANLPIFSLKTEVENKFL